MARFPFSNMPARVRKDPLGPITFNQLKANTEALQQLAGFEHDASGRHNAWEIPSVVGRSLWSGAAYSEYLYAESDAYVGASNPATGQVDITIDAGMLGDPYRMALAACCDEGVQNKPWVAVAEWSARDTLSVYLKKLSSALGAGNTWAAADGSFSVLMHGPPYAGFPSLSTITDKQRGDFLEEGTTDWNGIVNMQAGLRKLALVEHDSSGNHNAPRVCKEYGYVTYDSGAMKYVLEAGDISGVARVSTGVCTITTTATFSSTNTLAAFPEVLPASNVDLWIINYWVTSTTTLVVYMYQYDFGTKTWARADGDFFVPVWGA